GERPIRDPLAGPEFGHADRRGRAVATLRRRLDRREILLVVVAVAAEKEVFEAGAAAQAQGVPAEELPRHADDAELVVEQRDGQLRPHAVAVLALVGRDQLREEGRAERR